MSKRTISNPLALAVLAQLSEQPMHPYEIASQMRERNLHESIKLNYGSLYSVVEALQRDGLIVPTEQQREGRRPERTVYTLTAKGRGELFDWLRTLLSEPAREYTRFAAGLAFISLLAPTEAGMLLEERHRLLESEVAHTRSQLEALMDGSPNQVALPRVLLLEYEYGLMLREAELHWLQALIREFQAGTLDGLQNWTAYHSELVAGSVATGSQEKEGAA